MPRISTDDDNFIYYWVGKNIKKIRKQKGLTQNELADKCCYSDTFISNLENNTFQTISLNSLYHISKVLGIHIRDLFEDLEEDK